MNELTIIPECLARCEGDLARQAETHLTRCSEHAVAEAELATRRQAAPAELITASMKEIEAARRAMLDAELRLLRTGIGLWREREELCRQSCDALRGREADLETQLAAVRERVGKALRKVGISPESDPRFQTNYAAAETRFQLRVDEAADVRELAGRLAEIRAASAEAPRDAAEAQRQADAAEKRLLQIIELSLR